MILDSCDIPIMLAPLAGGPSTPELAAAVSNAGGLGFLASGYLSAAELAARSRRTGELTGRPFGVNLFAPGPAGDAARVRQFAAEIEADVSGAGARLGEPRHDDDDWDAKIGYLMSAPAAVVSFTFGIPGGDVIAGLPPPQRSLTVRDQPWPGDQRAVPPFGAEADSISMKTRLAQNWQSRARAAILRAAVRLSRPVGGICGAISRRPAGLPCSALYIFGRQEW